MHPVSYTFPTMTQNEICATNASAASGTTLVLNGSLSVLPPGGSGDANRYVALSGIARPIEVFSTGNINTATFTFTGLDVNGYALTTSFAGPSGSGVITQSVTEFSVVYTASVLTAAASPFTVGFGPSGITRAMSADGFITPMNTTYAVVKAATSGPISFQHTFDPILLSSGPPTWSAVTFGTGIAIASQTVATSVTVTENITACRAILVATAAATGVIQAVIMQCGV